MGSGLLMRLAAAGQVTIAVLFVAWSVWEGPTPLVRVRWSANLPAEVREATERELDLRMIEATDPDTFQYALGVARRDDIAALVQHPYVADTAGLDRQRFGIDPENAGVAPGRVWRGGVAFGGPDGARRFRVVFGTVTGATLLLTLLGIRARAAGAPDR